MPDHPLKPADRSEVLFNLSFALTNNGKRKFDQGRTFMARITAEHLLSHLERSGHVIMQAPTGCGGHPLLCQGQADDSDTAGRAWAYG